MSRGQIGPRFEALGDYIVERILEATGERSCRDRLLTSAEVAGRLGRSPRWVRAHAAELGVVRPKDGPRPRLYFRAKAIERRRNGR
jgi:hypothetical protein